MERLVYDLEEVAVHAPILNPEKIVAIGLNYLDHAKESGMEPPKQPIFFSKYPSSIIGPRSPVVLPPADLTSKVDYEVELALVIGRSAKNTPVEQAMDHVYGYTILNDISAARPAVPRRPVGQGEGPRHLCAPGSVDCDQRRDR